MILGEIKFQFKSHIRFKIGPMFSWWGHSTHSRKALQKGMFILMSPDPTKGLTLKKKI